MIRFSTVRLASGSAYLSFLGERNFAELRWRWDQWCQDPVCRPQRTCLEVLNL